MDDCCKIGGKKWLVSTLVVASKDLKPFDMPINYIDRSYFPLQYSDNFQDVVNEINRVQDADLTKPIIISACGVLMDGRHRVLKAMLKGKKTIKAVQFSSNPKEDYCE